MIQTVAQPAVARSPDATAGRVNLAHLDALSEFISLDGHPALLVHTYCEAPSYLPIGADGEGIAAVDDVARAALVYLDHWTATGQQTSLQRGRAALNFVLAMQTPGGGFYNFIHDRAGTINREGATSRLPLDWWDCRALWALARGYAVFRWTEPGYARRLASAYLRTEQLIARHIGEVGTRTAIQGVRVPAWLPNNSAALSALAVLAMAEHQMTTPNPATARAIAALADGLASFQIGGPGCFPWGLHPHSLGEVGSWHAWGAHEAQALARAGLVLGERSWIAAAQREVDGFFAWQLATERLHELTPLPVIGGQQSYGVNCMVQAAINLYHATGDPHYARLGGLHASWLSGGNAAGTPMYDPATGRGYDGIDLIDGAFVALQAVLPVPDAVRYLSYTPISGRSWQVIAAEEGNVRAGETGTLHFTIAEAGNYTLSLAHAPGAGVASPLQIAIDAAQPWAGPLAAEPHGEYRWLDPVTPTPVKFAVGQHTLRLDYEDGDQARPTNVAGFLLHPMVATRTFAGSDGARLRLGFDLCRGELSWEE
jgi:hypothetical protein